MNQLSPVNRSESYHSIVVNVYYVQYSAFFPLLAATYAGWLLCDMMDRCLLQQASLELIELLFVLRSFDIATRLVR